MHIITNANNPNYKTLNYWIMLDRSVSTDDNFKITLFSGAENEVEISGELITDTLNHDYGNYTVYKCESHTDFIYEWSRFVDVHQHDFERIYTALYTEYNPLENYDKHSTITDDGETGAPNDAPLTALSYQVADDTVNNENPYIPENKTTTSGKTEIDNTRTETTHGNIGVTKSTDMLRDEILTRIQHNFIDTVCRLYAELELI